MLPDKGLPSGLYALVDDGLCGDRVTQVASMAARGGAVVVQLRLKRLTEREALTTIVATLQALKPTGAKLIVNDRADWALACGADGVHLGADDLPIAQARRLLGPLALIGATTRGLSDIERAKEQGADHVGLGPVFTTTTKHVGHEPLGLAGLKAIAARSPLPVVAIAGITLETIGAVSACGVRAAAVGSDLLVGHSVEARAAALSAAFASQMQ